MPKVKFFFGEKEKQIEVKSGTSLLEASSKAGIRLNSICGGDGICGGCKVKVRGEGEGVKTEPTALLNREEIKEGYILACQTKVVGQVEVEVPPESRAEEGKILIDEDAQRFKALSSKEEFYKHDPPVKKIPLQLSEPDLKDNLADHQRLYREIRKKEEAPIMQMGLKVLNQVPDLVRKNDWQVTATLGKRGGTTEVIQLEDGDRSTQNYGIAIDIGTTTVVAHLVDLKKGNTLDAQARYNSQIEYGEEVTRRIIYSEENGLEKLQEAIIEDVNKLVSTLVKQNQLELDQITTAVCSGNTTMLHFLWGLDPSHIRKSPYVPASTSSPPIRAAEVGIKINPRGLLYSIPSIGGWVGGDITAGVLASGIHRMENLTMFIDIGTNGEILIGNKEWMLSASASAGPAFEGTGAKSGMRASKGAIEKVKIGNGNLRYSVIGEGKPKGICGSGLIDLVAELFEEGLVNRSGKLDPESSDRVKETSAQMEFVVVPATQSKNDQDITITQPDIENLIRAKAAIYAGAQILMESVDLEFTQLDNLLIAGGFGSYIDRQSAKTLGLIPDISLDKIKFVGNSSIIGAKMALLSNQALKEAQEISQSVIYYDLIDYPDYFDEFTRAKFLPHTDLSKFPNVEEQSQVDGR